MAAVVSHEAVWEVPKRDFEAEKRLTEALGIPSLVASVLVRRGFVDPEEADSFLNPSLNDLHDPKQLPDFESAIAAILGAKERGELIYVHGDYDVDGISSTALMTRFLRSIGCSVAPHVPHRMKEGYGIHPDAIRWAKDKGTNLFLTCDCGISAHGQLEMVYEAGMTAVVTDHHEPKSTLPKAEAVVNPHRADSVYPYEDLAGAGVVFKLCEGLSNELGHNPAHYYRAFLDLAVLGTVADVMPLTGENRVITKFGLDYLQSTKKAGLKALMDVSQIKSRVITSRDIGFKLGPRINAVGRIDDANVALELFLTKDESVAKTHAEYMDRRNTERRSDQQTMVERATERVLEEGLDQKLVMVVADKDWHPGIIGIVAGKLTEQFRRPTFVVALGEDGVGKGSARSLAGFNLAEAIEKHKDLIMGGGGHAAAAGITISEDQIPAFRESLHTYASGFLSAEDFRPKIVGDAEVELKEAGPLAAEALEALQPFGEANQEPLFMVRNVRLSSVRPMRNLDHATVSFSDGDSLATGVAWGIAPALEAIGAGSTVDVAFKLEINEYRGTREVRWNVQDVRKSS